MVDAVLVRGLLRYFAGTVVLSHNAAFSFWRRSAIPANGLMAILREDRVFLDHATADIVDLCHEIGCTMPEDFLGLSKLSSIIARTSLEPEKVRDRFREDHLQMVDDATFLLTVVPFETLPSSEAVLSSQSTAHENWSRRWGNGEPHQ